jgi:endoglucanase
VAPLSWEGAQQAAGRRTVNEMTVKIAFVIALASLLALPAAADDLSPSPFRRGIAISHSMGWAEIGPGQRFVQPAFSGPDRELTLGELTSLRAMGFDFIRLAVDPGPFLQASEDGLRVLERILVDRVHLILRSRLSVVVDLHPSDLHPEFLDKRLASGARTLEFRAYLRVLDRLARLLGELKTPRVALEIMNEPPVSGYAWQPMLDAAYRTVRNRAPELMIVASDGLVHLDQSLRTLAPFVRDPAILFSFHYYAPLEFTHQGASWGKWRYLADVPYPPNARPLTDTVKATQARIAAAPLTQQQKATAVRDAELLLSRYQRAAPGRTTIARYFDIASAWARANNVPSNRIFLGEFGVLEGEASHLPGRAEERARWLREVREEADQRRFSWAVWTYKGAGGFALSTGGSIPPMTRQALGLKQ